jgi:hypothetical protein
MLTVLKIWTNWASALRTQHTLQSNVNCAVKSSAVSKDTQSRNFNCTNVRYFQHTLDLTAQLLAVQLKLKVKLYVCGAPYKDTLPSSLKPKMSAMKAISHRPFKTGHICHLRGKECWASPPASGVEEEEEEEEADDADCDDYGDDKNDNKNNRLSHA